MSAYDFFTSAYFVKSICAAFAVMVAVTVLWHLFGGRK